MPEPSEQLRDALDDLNQALESSAAVDTELRKRLDHAVQEIHAVLARLPKSESRGAGSESVAGQMAGIARDFEASHPTLSGMVGSVIDALARMGI